MADNDDSGYNLIKLYPKRVLELVYTTPVRKIWKPIGSLNGLAVQQRGLSILRQFTVQHFTRVVLTTGVPKDFLIRVGGGA